HRGLKSQNVFLYPGVEMIIEDATDKATIIAKLDSEILTLENEVKRCQGMLSNPSFVSKAPAEKIAAENEKLGKYQTQLALVKEKRSKL
ncbi:MAG: hypothetical protein NTV44_04700, partial [Firmicutes bacterium]|nr:hypothetical protein [Bacillota bacterium]